MKKQTIPALVILILSLVIAIGSQSFLGPCVHEDGSFGACHWAGRMLLGVGALLAALSALSLALPSPGLYAAMALTAVLGFLAPGTLIDLCGMATMRCRMVMQPAARVLFALALPAALVGAALARGRAKRT